MRSINIYGSLSVTIFLLIGLSHQQTPRFIFLCVQNPSKPSTVIELIDPICKEAPIPANSVALTSPNNCGDCFKLNTGAVQCSSCPSIVELQAPQRNGELETYCLGFKIHPGQIFTTNSCFKECTPYIWVKYCDGLTIKVQNSTVNLIIPPTIQGLANLNTSPTTLLNLCSSHPNISQCTVIPDTSNMTYATIITHCFQTKQILEIPATIIPLINTLTGLASRQKILVSIDTTVNCSSILQGSVLVNKTSCQALGILADLPSEDNCVSLEQGFLTFGI